MFTFYLWNGFSVEKKFLAQYTDGRMKKNFSGCSRVDQTENLQNQNFQCWWISATYDVANYILNGATYDVAKHILNGSYCYVPLCLYFC